MVGRCWIIMNDGQILVLMFKIPTIFIQVVAFLVWPKLKFKECWKYFWKNWIIQFSLCSILIGSMYSFFLFSSFNVTHLLYLFKIWIHNSHLPKILHLRILKTKLSSIYAHVIIGELLLRIFQNLTPIKIHWRWINHTK